MTQFLMTRSRTWTAAPVLAAGALLLAACGGSGGSSAGSATSAGAAGGATTTASAAGTAVGVTEREFAITLDRKTFTAGTYTFTVHNVGTFPHNLTIAGPGVDTKASATLDPGQSGSLTVTLSKGSYELWCAVDSHKERGMDLKVQVS